MAELDPNILLGTRTTGNLSALAQGASQGIRLGGMLEQLQRAKEEAPLRQQLLQQQQAAGQLAIDQANQAQAQAEENRLLGSIANTYSGVKDLVDTGKFNDAADALEANKAVLARSGVTNFEDSDIAINALRSGDAQAIRRIQLQGDQAIRIAESRGLFEKDIGTEGKNFEALTKGFTPTEKALARRVKAGLAPRAVGSAATTIAETGVTEIVAESQATIEGRKSQAKAEAKAIGEAKTAPLIAKTKADIATAVTLATTAAIERGEALSELNIANASLPGLQEVVGQLKELAPIATNTFGGRAFDTVVKEFGFGATKGSTAKAKFVAIVNNQVLPLLRQTFGAAFTAKEGETLKATLGDPDSSADEKLVQLDAFIDSKIREIRTKERQVGISAPGAQAQPQDTGITEAQFRAMTPEQRAATIQQLQAQ